MKICKFLKKLKKYMSYKSDFRFDDGSALEFKQVNITDWNMDTTNSVVVELGVNYTDIVNIQVFIRNDANTAHYLLSSSNDSGTTQGFILMVGTQVQLTRATDGFFDAFSFSSTSFNRGFINIIYKK